jgi:hypothetical protein
MCPFGMENDRTPYPNWLILLRITTNPRAVNSISSSLTNQAQQVSSSPEGALRLKSTESSSCSSAHINYQPDRNALPPDAAGGEILNFPVTGYRSPSRKKPKYAARTTYSMPVSTA